MSRALAGWLWLICCLFAALIVVLLNLVLGVASLAVTCLVIYFFLAAGGVLPPLDFVPFVPYV